MGRVTSSLQWADDMTLARVHREECELMPCGHAKKYQCFGLPGAVTCILCDLAEARKKLRELTEAVIAFRNTRGKHDGGHYMDNTVIAGTLIVALVSYCRDCDASYVRAEAELDKALDKAMGLNQIEAMNGSAAVEGRVVHGERKEETGLQTSA
jgi:hypothetical protein